MEFFKRHSLILVIVFFHLIGLVGFLTVPNKFTELSYVNLLLSVALIFYSSKQMGVRFYFALISIACIGFLAEVIGVKTGYLFGNYKYGDAFGLKLLDVPLMIGVNWAILSYSSLQLVNFKNRFINAILASVLMVFLDYFIEQCAQQYDFWFWQDGIIPIKNYIDWFMVAFIVNFTFEPFLKKHENKLSKQFYLVQLLFFVFLLIFSKLL
jgi:putative membrane protein